MSVGTSAPVLMQQRANAVISSAMQSYPPHHPLLCALAFKRARAIVVCCQGGWFSCDACAGGAQRLRELVRHRIHRVASDRSVLFSTHNSMLVKAKKCISEDSCNEGFSVFFIQHTRIAAVSSECVCFFLHARHAGGRYAVAFSINTFVATGIASLAQVVSFASQSCFLNA